MAITTARDLVAASLREIGVLQSGESPSAEDAADALDSLNGLLNQWAAEDLTIGTITRTLATLTASQSSFTVGPGGDINIARPVFIDHVSYVDNSVSPAIELPLQSLDDDAYQALPLKGLTATRPWAYYYDSTYPLGTLTPYPISTGASLQWAIYAGTATVELATLATAFAMPPAYQRALVKNLALELCPQFSREPHPLLVQQAAKAMAVLKRSNNRNRLVSFDAGALIGNGGGRYDIYSNSYIGR